MDIFSIITQKLAAGESFILSTIVKTAGSSPRDVGAKMLVYPDGSISGTIGGGTFEKFVIDDCLELFKSKDTHLLRKYKLSDSGPEATGMYCGGEAEVFLEMHGSPDFLIIFGGGHIGQKLTQIASEMNFRITVVDDRQDILQQYNPPMEMILTDQEFNSNFPRIDKNSYVVVVTHGHKGDKAVLEKVLNENCAYIGMIGSKTKVKKVFAELEKSGFDKSLLKKIHAPIGLDIGAEGPYEIAVSIAAELISVRKTSKAAN